MAENEKYLDSIEGKISKFNASYEQLSTTTINSDFIKGLVDAGTEFLDVLNEIVDTLGSLASLVGVSGILGTISKHGLIKPGAMSMGIPQLAQSMASSVTSGVQTGINQLKNKQFLGAAQSVGGGIGNALSVGIGAALQTTAQTDFINSFDAIKRQGLKASEEQARINNLITNSAYGADAALHTVINTQNLQGKTTAEVTAMIHAQNRAWEAAKLKALAANLALTAGFVIIVSVITKAIEAAKRAKKAAIDAATDFDFLSSEISKTEEEYRKLNDVLVDNESSIDDINSAKESLLSLQDSLIDTYGKEAEGIDLVNGKYDEQIEKIRLLREEKAKDLIRENRTEYNKISDKLNEAYYPVSVGSNIVGSFNSTLQDAISTLDKNNESLSLVSDGSNTTAKVETTVKNGLKDLEILYDEFESLLAYVESDFERNYINGILNAISRSITEWKDKYEEDLAAYEKYGQAHAVANDTIISADNSNGDTVTTRVNDAYENYADAVEKYNDALKSGVDEEINAAKSRLDDMQLVIGRIRELDAGDFNLDEDSYNAMIDAFNAIESQIDRITEKKNAVKNDFESIQNGSRGTLEYLSDTGKTEVVDKNLFNSIKEMKMSMTEFDAFMNSDNGKNYFDTLNAAATSAELTLDELLSILRELGLFSNLESPISDEDIELYIKHKDALEDVVNGSKDVASLTDAERAAWERFNVVAAERNAKERELLALYQQTYSNDATTSVTALVSASDNLESALTKTEDALKDIDTVVKTVNGKMHLTDEQMVDLVSRHADLAEHLTWTEKGWTLEADAMDLVKDASANLQSAYITAQQKMTELCASGVGQRIEMYGIELRSMQSIMSAFSVGANGLVGMKLASSVYETEEGKAFADAALATGNTIVTDSSNEFEAESKAVVYAWRLNKQIEESLAAMEAAKSAADRTSGGGGKSVEKYKAEIDKLYKSLEKQKEIEEDIDNIQRERESFHEDDYLPYYMPKDSVNNAGKEVLDEYNAILNEIEKKGIDVNKTVYGNIDTNSRQVLEWTEQNLEKYRDEINSWTDWGQNADDYLGSYSTVDGRSSNFDGVEIAFTPILNTDNGPVYLSQDSVYEYIDRLIGAAGEGWTDEKLLELDARGMEIDGRRIRNLIAGIGEEAIKAGEAMHYVGKDGALAEAERRLAEYPVIILDETEAKKASSIQADKIKNIYKEISALERLNDTLHEQNEIRRSMINQNIADLQKYGFSVSYNSAYNELLINNYEELNTLVTSYAKRLGYGTEKTNELIKSVEALVQETHELNDANKENSATWQENTQAIKDYIKEIKNLKAEMVDDYLDKKENYLSHMQDFELWDAAKSVEYLEGMLHDLEDFYNAGLIDYEKFVEEYQAITKRIYDSRKDSLEYILDMVEDMIRQELEDQVDAYEEQKDALNDIIDAKKKIIQLAKEENDYNKSLEDKIKEMARLQERIAQLELDDSREASAEKAGLIEQLAELQSEVDSMQYDKSIEMQENALDEMGEANEKAIDKEIEQLEDLANNAEYIHDKTIEYIRENWDSLLSDLISYNNMYGDGIDENVTQNWENAKSALQEYRDAAWEVAKEMTTGQAVHGTVNEFMPVVGETAQDVINQAQNAEITNLVNRMRANSAKWPTADSNGKLELQRQNDDIANQIEQITGKNVERKNNGVWYINGEELYEKYPAYHTGGTVGELKDNELFALLEKGEDVLTEQQQRIAVPLLKAGIDMLNLSEGARSVFEFIKNMATPNLSMLRDSNESLVYAPEVNVTVTSNGGDADEIANAVKDRVLDAINGTFNKMGVSSKFKSIRV